MKYNPPYGISDPNAAYINGDPSVGRAGSIPPAESIELPQREIVAMITAGQFTPDNGDLQQLLKSIRRQYVNFAVDGGTANNLSIALSPALESYHAGLPLRVLVAVTNTGASVINVNGLGPRAIKRNDGSALQAGDIIAGMIANITDNGSVFQLQNPLIGVAGTSNTFQTDIPYCADSSVTVNLITAVFSPAITTITEGKFIAVKIANTNTSAVTIAVNALTVLPVRSQAGVALQAGDLLAGEAMLFENHNTYYQVMSFVPSQMVAPKLRGFMVSQSGQGAQDIPISVDTNIAYYTVSLNQLQTSTWDGFGLTVGAGEGGIWSIYACAHMAQVSQPCNFASTTIRVNGVAQAITSSGDVTAGSGNALGISASILANPGDKIAAYCYHQTAGGVHASIIGDNLTRFSAFLISK